MAELDDMTGVLNCTINGLNVGAQIAGKTAINSLELTVRFMKFLWTAVKYLDSLKYKKEGGKTNSKNLTRKFNDLKTEEVDITRAKSLAEVYRNEAIEMHDRFEKGEKTMIDKDGKTVKVKDPKIPKEVTDKMILNTFNEIAKKYSFQYCIVPNYMPDSEGRYSNMRIMYSASQEPKYAEVAKQFLAKFKKDLVDLGYTEKQAADITKEVPDGIKKDELDPRYLIESTGMAECTDAQFDEAMIETYGDKYNEVKMECQIKEPSEYKKKELHNQIEESIYKTEESRGNVKDINISKDMVESVSWNDVVVHKVPLSEYDNKVYMLVPENTILKTKENGNNITFSIKKDEKFIFFTKDKNGRACPNLPMNIEELAALMRSKRGVQKKTEGSIAQSVEKMLPSAGKRK